MVAQDSLATSKAIQKRTGRTFYVATRLLPKAIRHATYVLYAFFRIADDVVDDPNPPPAATRRETLRRIRSEALGTRPSDDSILLAFRHLREKYGIPHREVEEFIAAMEADIDASRYDTYADLEDYLRGSSVAVAYMMLAVMEPDDSEAARPHAKALGEAFQLTNFLRDVREDVQQYGRIYLPRATLESHGVSDDEVMALEFSPGFAAAIREELARTERLYRHGVDGIATLPKGCQFPVLLAAVLYADHHRLIRAQGFDVLTSRPTLSLTRRVELLVRTWVHWRLSKDPRATFDAVSAVPSIPENEHSGPADSSSEGAGQSPPRGRGVGRLASLAARRPMGVIR